MKQYPTARARSASPDIELPPVEATHASIRRARSRAAVPYLQRWRPLVMTVLLAVTLVATRIRGSAFDAGVIAPVVLSLAMTALAAGLVWLGFAAGPIAFAVTIA